MSSGVIGGRMKNTGFPQFAYYAWCDGVGIQVAAYYGYEDGYISKVKQITMVVIGKVKCFLFGWWWWK